MLLSILSDMVYGNWADVVRGRTVKREGGRLRCCEYEWFQRLDSLDDMRMVMSRGHRLYLSITSPKDDFIC